MEGHADDLLSCRNRPFSKEKMRVLAAVCEALIPSLEVNPNPNSEPHHDIKQQIIPAFYKLSASADGLPQHVARCMARYLRPADYGKMEMLLQILSTRPGTRVLSGVGLLKLGKFKSFHRLSVMDREKILRNWTLGSPSPSLRLPFLLLKLFILREFYSRVDESNRSPIIWPAIDYCGPDPTAIHITEPDEFDMVLESRIVDMTKINPRTKQILSTDLGMKAISAIPVSCTSRRRKQKLVQKKKVYGRLEEISLRLEMKADVAIIGSGCGGSVVAAKLAEQGYKVVVLEKGKYLPRVENQLLENQSSELYELGGYLATDDLSVFLFAGSTVGGGSTVNWSASFKTPAHVRREWADPNGLHGLPLFESERYSRAMDEVCERIGVQEEVEGGTSGESLANAMLRKGCQAMGLEVACVPRNAAPDHKCGWCGMGCKSGGKMSTGRTWLLDAARRGAVILCGCEATRVKLERNVDAGPGIKRLRAAGVEARVVATRRNARRLLSGGNVESVEGEEGNILREEELVGIHIDLDARVVVAACGALWTPPLLRRSGLRNKHIGRHLHLHPVMFSWGYFPDAPDDRKSYMGAIMSSVSLHAANWSTSGYGALLMVPTLHPGTFAAVSPWLSGRDAKDSMLRFSKTAYVIAITRDSGDSGRVWEDENGDLHLAYKVCERDREHCVAAMCHGIRVLAAAGAREIGTSNLDAPSVDMGAGASEKLEEFVAHVEQTSMRGRNGTVVASAHQMGSCRMGCSSSSSAVEQSGEAWEASGLFVADASVFPTASGVNPMVTVQSIAVCISQSILRFLQP